jgi:hypothetical protein
MKRRLELGAATLLGAMGLLVASGAFAVSIPAGEVYTLPLAPGDTMTVDLGVPTPGFPQWNRLRPGNPSDPLADYTATVDCIEPGCPGSGAGTPSNASVYDLVFDVTWNGTIDQATPGSGEAAPQMLFAILDSRFERTPGGDTYATTNDLPSSGFVRSTPGFDRFFVDDGVTVVAVTPEIVRDAPLGGFVSDDYDYDWIGFYLDAVPGVTYSISVEWALGQMPDQSQGGQNVFFPNALFLATVPEPGTAAMMAVGILILAARGRRRRA